MKVTVTQRLSNYAHVIGREPSTIVWTRGVHKIEVKNGELIVEADEKNEIQHLKLPTDALHKVVLEFSRF